MSTHEGSVQEYSNAHRAFLQALFARPVITLEEAKPILARIESIHGRPTQEHEVQEADLRRYIHIINAQLLALDYEVRSTTSQHDKSKTTLYALVNTTSDPQTQLATTLVADEVAYVKRLLDAMFETPGGSSGDRGHREVFAVSLRNAIKLRMQARDSGVGMAAGTGDETQPRVVGGVASTITIQRAEAVLNELVEGRWFEKSRASFYSLGPRGLMELRGWLQETYDEPVHPDDSPEDIERGKRIRFCAGCREVLTVGQRCAERTCSFRLHDTCAQRFFRSTGEAKCAKCGRNWDGENNPVGERASRDYPNNRSSGARASTGDGMVSRSLGTRAEDVDEDMN